MQLPIKKYLFNVYPYYIDKQGIKCQATRDQHQRIVEATNPLEAQRQLEMQYRPAGAVIGYVREV